MNADQHGGDWPAANSAPAAKRDGIRQWFALALLVMVAHVILIGINWLLDIGLTVPLLAPGFLLNEMLDLPKARSGYTPTVIAASASFYAVAAFCSAFDRSWPGSSLESG